MAPHIEILRVSPLTTIQDRGRNGHFASGISASGPMDVRAFEWAGGMSGCHSEAGIEFTTAGLSFRVEGADINAAFSGGAFELSVDGQQMDWNNPVSLSAGSVVEVRPGSLGNYGYVRFSAELDVPPLLGSRSTNLVVGLGGYEGRALRAGDRIPLAPIQTDAPQAFAMPKTVEQGPIRFTWGIHADKFSSEVKAAFCERAFSVSSRLDRMGVRLADPSFVFGGLQILSLVSDPVLPGDIQILGDGTPIVLMRDHQPTGGYPRIGTVASVDLDRFAQLRPGSELQFEAISVPHAHMLYKEAARL